MNSPYHHHMLSLIKQSTGIKCYGDSNLLIKSAIVLQIGRKNYVYLFISIFDYLNDYIIIHTLQVLILDSPTTFSSLVLRDSRIQRPYILVSVDSLLTYLEPRPYIIKIHQVLMEKSSIF